MSESTWIYLIVQVPFVMWTLSIYWLSKWKRFWYFFWINVAISTLALVYFLFIQPVFDGADPYGLDLLFSIIFYLMAHSLVGFIFALLYKVSVKYGWFRSKQST